MYMYVTKTILQLLYIYSWNCGKPITEMALCTIKVLMVTFAYTLFFVIDCNTINICSIGTAILGALSQEVYILHNLLIW